MKNKNRENPFMNAARWMMIGAALLASSAVQAEGEKFEKYAAVHSFNWEVGNNFADGSGVRLTLGHQLNDYLAVEVQGATGGGREVTLYTIATPAVPFTAEARLDQMLGAYLRAQVPLGERVKVFGLFGYTKAKLEVESGAGAMTGSGQPLDRSAFTESESGLSYGGGLEIGIFPGLLNDRLKLGLDYMVYLDGDVEAKATSVGLRLDF